MVLPVSRIHIYAACLPYPVFVIVLQFAALYAYLCLPRFLLLRWVPSSELQLTRGFYDQTLAYVGVLLGAYYLVQTIRPAPVRRALTLVLVLWVHLDFLLRCGEAALMYQFDI